MTRARAARIAWLLFALAVLRAGWFVAHKPMLGLANNYDMIRVQGCIDAYPVRDASIPPWSNSYEAPIEQYAFRDDLEPGCFLSSEALFAFTAYPLMRIAAGDDGQFSLRVLGAVKVFALFAVFAWAIRRFLQRQRDGTAIGVAVIAFSVFADPGVLVYANAMYAEFAAVFFLAWLLLAVAEAVRRGRIGLLSALILIAVTVAFALSKVQHLVTAFLPIAVLLFLKWYGARLPRRLVPALLVGAVIGLVVQVMHLRSDRLASMRQANVTNAVLGALLPQSDDPAQTAERLGLPRECGRHAGKSWFTPGVAETPPCPELLSMSRMKLFGLLFSEPETLVRTWYGGLMRMRPWIPAGLGKVEGEKLAPIPASTPSWNTLVVALPEIAYAFFVLSPIWFAIVVFELRRRLRVPPATLFLLGTSALLPLAVITLVVFGDGYADPQRHGQLVFTSLLVFWHALPLALLSGKLAARNNAFAVAQARDAAARDGWER